MSLRCRRVAAMLLIAFAAGGCGTEPDDPPITPGSSDRWHVHVTGPRGDDSRIEDCLDDLAIEESIQTANLPSTHLSIKLQTTAAEADAKRIADCLHQSLESGDVSIASPAD